MSKHSMLQNLQKRIKVTLDDGRDLTGKLQVYDHHMNVVLSDVTETRPQTKKMKESGVSATRSLGLVLLRGEHVVSVTVLEDSSHSSKKGTEPNFSKAPKLKNESGKKRTRDENEDE